MKYRALMTIWHSRDNTHYEAGAEVSMDHLDAQHIAALVKGGIIAPVEDEKPPARPVSREVKEG